MASRNGLLSLLIILLGVIHISNGLIGKRFWKFRELVEASQHQRIDSILTAKNQKHGYKLSKAETYYVEQPLDHFNALSKVFGKTYKQRYYINKEHWAATKNPVFLYVGGEGTLTSRSIEAGEIYELAQQFQALLVGLEHRFYGASLNDDGLQYEELQYLSSQQALADLAAFIQHVRGKHNVPDTTLWVTFGGSYPGALSAWARLKYPHLVFASLASSAPVKAVTNFEGYNEVVAASLKSPEVGGSQDCLDAVSKAFKEIDFLITTSQFDKLEEDFLSCGPVSEKMDSVTFVSNLAGNIMGVVQYNNEIPGQNISHICQVMTSSTDSPYTNLIALNKEFLEISQEKCQDNSYTNYTLQLMNTTVDRTAVGAGMRQWIYQTCSQFGYYQTCDTNTTCPFSRLMTLEDSDLQVCQHVFKIDPSGVNANVQFSLEYYGGKNTQQSRIIYANGSIDPWHWLGVLTDNTELKEYAVFINGTAHCADLGVARDSDPQSLTQARLYIAAILSSFFKGETGDIRVQIT